jgi:arsenate reductase-like glutaredoxin family protein
VKINEETSASKKLGAEKALELAKGASRIIVMRGKKITDFDMKKDPPAKEDLLAVMLGTTGNMRAPTIVRGKTLLVGFNQEIYDDLLG